MTGTNIMDSPQNAIAFLPVEIYVQVSLVVVIGVGSGRVRVGVVGETYGRQRHVKGREKKNRETAAN